MADQRQANDPKFRASASFATPAHSDPTLPRRLLYSAPSQTFRVNPGNPCPLGPRTDPNSPDAGTGDAATVQALVDQIAALSARLAALEAGRK